jgi:hypothetical protein
MFSRFAIGLRKTDVLSRVGMAEILKRSYHNRAGGPVQVAHLDRFTNISDWIHPYINDSAFLGICQYRQFLIASTGAAKGEKRQTVIRAREACANQKYKTWTGIAPKGKHPGIRTLPWSQGLGAPPLVLRGMPPAQSRSMDEADKNAVCRGTKVQTVVKGFRTLIRKKNIPDKHKDSLEADLALLASDGRLGIDLTNGANALKNLVPSGEVGGSDSEQFSDLDNQRVCMKSGYELKVGMNIAVLVNAAEHRCVWERWNFAKVGSIEPDRDCPADEVGCIVRTRYYTQHGRGQGG